MHTKYFCFNLCIFFACTEKTASWKLNGPNAISCILLPLLIWLNFYLSKPKKEPGFNFPLSTSQTNKPNITTMATVTQPCPSWTRGSVPLSKRVLPRRRFTTRLTTYPQAALVQAPPPPPPSSPRDSSSSIQLLTLSRANDLQAEARAMARAANATVYNPQLIASMYGSQPIKVLPFSPFWIPFWKFFRGYDSVFE